MAAIRASSYARRPPQTHGIVAERRPLPAATSTRTSTSARTGPTWRGPAAGRSGSSFPRADRLGRVDTLCALLRASSVTTAAVCEHILPVRLARLVRSRIHAHAGRSGRAHNAHRSLVVLVLFLLLIRPPADPRLRFVLPCWPEPGPRPATRCSPAARQPRKVALVPFAAGSFRRGRGSPEEGVPAQPAAAQ